MFKDNDTEQLLAEMSLNRGEELAYRKARVTEEFSQYEKEKLKAWKILSNDFTENQRQIFSDHQAALALEEGVIHHYIYLQGLKDGITLANAV